MNNYGVWADEFAELGLEGTLDRRWPDAHCWFGERHEVRVGRAYGRCRCAPSLLFLNRTYGRAPPTAGSAPVDTIDTLAEPQQAHVPYSLHQTRPCSVWLTPLQPPELSLSSPCECFRGPVSAGSGCALSRVCRRRLRAHLLRRCAAGGVRFRAGELVRLEPNETGETAALALADGSIVRTRYPIPYTLNLKT